jgi:hypothetical protein
MSIVGVQQTSTQMSQMQPLAPNPVEKSASKPLFCRKIIWGGTQWNVLDSIAAHILDDALVGIPR